MHGGGWQLLRYIPGTAHLPDLPRYQQDGGFLRGERMTSEERREARFRRRCIRREEKRQARHPEADCYESVFAMENLRDAHRKCRRGVGWKGSVQRYGFTASARLARLHDKLIGGRYQHVKPFEWDTWERGALRHIKSTTIEERTVQRCLADHCLLPIVRPMLIHDNGACMKGKGYGFAIDRLICHLQRHYRRYGDEGYILLFDLSKFYESVDHDKLLDVLFRRVKDERLRQRIVEILKSAGERGLCLGSQISQILALLAASHIDRYVKQGLRVRCYARYNDDGYLIHPSKKFLQVALDGIKRVCREAGLILNEKKTRIVKLRHGFRYLKARFYILPGGRILRKIPKRSIVLERRKLKKLRGKIAPELVIMQYQSWRAFAERFSAWRTMRNMDGLFCRLFPELGKEVRT